MNHKSAPVCLKGVRGEDRALLSCPMGAHCPGLTAVTCSVSAAAHRLGNGGFSPLERWARRAHAGTLDPGNLPPPGVPGLVKRASPLRAAALAQHPLATQSPQSPRSAQMWGEAGEGQPCSPLGRSSGPGGTGVKRRQRRSSGPGTLPPLPEETREAEAEVSPAAAQPGHARSHGAPLANRCLDSQ